MYICICNGINERSVNQAIDGGATKVADIYRANSCAPRCGQCVPDMRQALQARATDIADGD
ncbi:MAG: (2Fe-2S)-binding protein [Alphaproteobacteria bacterium]